MVENIKQRNADAIVWLHSKESTLDTDDIPKMIRAVSVFGIEHVAKVIFSYIEIFGGACKNNDFAPARVEFIKKYFGKVNPRYEKLGGLFYSVYRHGLIHDFHPKRFDYNNLHYEWQISKENSERHLAILKADQKTRILHISLKQFYLDLKEALKFYFEDLEHNEELRNNAGEKVSRIQSRYEYKIKSGKVVEVELYTNKENPRPYILPKELEYLKLLEEQNKKIEEQNKLIAEQNQKLAEQNDILTQIINFFKNIFGWK